jgi:hypothetical protein
VAAALYKASGECDARALARHGNEAERIECIEQLITLNTCANLHGRACVVGLVVRVENLDILEVMRPDGEGAGAGRAAKVTVGNIKSSLYPITYRRELAYSCPVFLTVRRMLFLRAKRMAAATWSVVETSTVYTA